MPIKLIGTVILIVIVGIFCGFNTGDAHCCDINFVFHTLHRIPVFLTVLLSFLCGVLVMIPFTIHHEKSDNSEPKTEFKEEKSENISENAIIVEPSEKS